MIDIEGQQEHFYNLAIEILSGLNGYDYDYNIHEVIKNFDRLNKLKILKLQAELEELGIEYE